MNAIFRIGGGLAARLPLVGHDPAQVRVSLLAEADAMGELADAATVPTPEPVALGDPGPGYPLPWIVQSWVPGHDATVEEPGGSNTFAHDLAALIAGMRAVDTRGRRFDGLGRGGHLPDHDEWLGTCFRHSEGLLDVPLLRRIWAELRTLPEVDEHAMCHRDLIPPNVLVNDGRLVGVLDGGGFGPADPSLDLVAAWHLLDETRRGILRRELGCGAVQWRRGMAWAFQQATGLVRYCQHSNPTMSRWQTHPGPHHQRLDRPEQGRSGYASVTVLRGCGLTHLALPASLGVRHTAAFAGFCPGLYLTRRRPNGPGYNCTLKPTPSPHGTTTMSRMNGVDDYGLPADILGRQPDEFYGAIGRVVCVCAVLEDTVTTLRHTLAATQQGQYTQQQVSKQIDAARSLSQKLGDSALRTIRLFLDDVEVAFRRRNDLVHSSFPAQPDGRIWGHRPNRDRSVIDGTADYVETSINDLRAFIGELAELVRRFNQVHAMASAARGPA